MDIVFLVAAAAAALLLPRPKALVATLAAWAGCVVLVGWGPAHNSDVHTASAGFWVPWAVVLVLGAGLCLAISTVRLRRAGRAS
jgi:drug/metabolite transporter (DMT)-like permease